jgi:hypothetical protein
MKQVSDISDDSHKSIRRRTDNWSTHWRISRRTIRRRTDNWTTHWRIRRRTDNWSTHWRIRRRTDNWSTHRQIRRRTDNWSTHWRIRRRTDNWSTHWRIHGRTATDRLLVNPFILRIDYSPLPETRPCNNQQCGIRGPTGSGCKAEIGGDDNAV